MEAKHFGCHMSLGEAQVRLKLAEDYDGIKLKLELGEVEGEVIGLTQVSPEAWKNGQFDKYSQAVSESIYGNIINRGKRKVK